MKVGVVHWLYVGHPPLILRVPQYERPLTKRAITMFCPYGASISTPRDGFRLSAAGMTA